MTTNPLLRAAKEICTFLHEQQCCLIGGLAVLCWGEIRFTQDVDLAVFVDYGAEKPLAEKLLQRFTPRFNDANTAMDFALSNRVLLLKTADNIALDVTFSALSFEREMLARKVLYQFDDDLRLPVCRADDLLVMKFFAARPKDLNDAHSIIIRQANALDKTYILRHLAELAKLKNEPEIFHRAEKMLEQQ